MQRFIRVTYRNSIFFSVLLFAPVLSAQFVPGKYIVELDTEPVAEHVFRMRAAQGVRSAAATAHRTRIREEQDGVQARIEAKQFQVLDRLDTVANALIVDATDASQLASIQGVKRVHQVRLFRPVLDRALALHKVPDAWNRIGGSGNAGVGVKIGIIDTGIDSTRPGFQDSSMTAPSGFPKVNNSSDTAYTSGKIIVARSYVSLLQSRDPDNSIRDHMGHGTALAMVSAGATSEGPLATITGVAPKAYLGVYKVFGTPGYNDSATDSAILKAVDDAVKDGMDVINLSLGSDLAPRFSDDIDAQAVERAVQSGVIVVVAAGNNGTDPNTIASPGTAPSAITAGASTNDRTFAATVEAQGLLSTVAVPGTGAKPASDITAAVVDVTTLDGNGLGCASFPQGSLQGQIALIQRGTCTFETKLNNAQAAGAVGGLVYATAAAPAAFTMDVGAATLPAEMIDNPSGVAIAQAAGGGSITVVLRFTLGPTPITSNQITDFSAAGPNVDLGIKPDILAVGGSIYVATQTFDSNGDMYDPSGFILVDGTSFSTPLTAGAAALLKSARPGLTVNQYRSLLIHSGAPVTLPTGEILPVQRTGGGLLDVNTALQLTAAAAPISLSFGTTRGTLSQTLTITNVGTATDTFALSAVPVHGGVGPNIDNTQIQLDPGASAIATLSWDTSTLSTGTYDGAVSITAGSTGIASHVPFWFATSTGTPTHVTLIAPITTARRGSIQSDAFYVRVTDDAGLVISNPDITVTPVSGGGRLRAVHSYDGQVPGVVGIDVVMGSVAGTNVFQIKCGSATVNVSIAGT